MLANAIKFIGLIVGIDTFAEHYKYPYALVLNKNGIRNIYSPIGQSAAGVYESVKTYDSFAGNLDIFSGSI